MFETTGPLIAVWRDVDASSKVTEGIAAAEQAWRGGIADFGDHEAASLVQQMPGYPAYAKALRRALASHIGFPLTVYRSMPEDGLEDYMANPYSTEWATSLSITTAERFAKFAGHDAATKLLISISLANPKAVIMRGKLDESELVIDTGWIGVVEDAIHVVKQLM